MPALRYYIVLFSLLLTGLVVPAAAAPAEDQKTIVFSGDSNSPPFEQLVDGKPTGFNIDLERAMARAGNAKAEIRLDKWPKTIAGLLSGEIDVAPMIRSPERERYFTFSRAIYFVHHAIYTAADPGRVATIDKLRGWRVAVEENSDGHDRFRGPGTPKVKLVVTGSTLDALQAVAHGRADYAVLPTQTANELIKRHKLNVHRVGAPLWSRDYAFAVRKDRPELAAWVNAALEETIVSGEFQNIFDAWSLDALSGIGPRPKEPGGALWLLLASLAVGGSLFGYLYARGRNEASVAAERARRSEAEREARFLARHDRVTGLANREHFIEAAAVVVSNANDTHQYEVFALKILNLPAIAQTHGRGIAEQVLCAIADRLRAVDAAAGVTAGSAFAFVVDISASQGLLEAIGAPVHVGDSKVKPDIAWGAARAPEHSTDPHDLLHKAEIALAACVLRRRSWLLYEPSLEPSPGDMQLVSDFRAANPGDLIAVYQPQLDLKTGRLVAAEALVRWRHPKRGLVPPAEIIPLLEGAGLIQSVTRTMIEETARQSARFRRAGVACRFSVNLSVHDLVDRDVAAEFAEAFVRYGANPKDITAELTESGAVENPARVRHVLDELKAMGMGTAIDDYGTGFSSLASLADLPFDELKIDQLFVRQMVDSPSYESIVRSTVRMAHELGLKVVAEGAETARTVSALATIDCDKVQGYAVSQPVPADDLLLLVSRFAWRSWEPTQQVAELHRRRFA